MTSRIIEPMLSWLDRRPYRVLAGLYALCVVAFIAAIPLPRVDKQLIGSDGVYYYAYLPTLLLDHDLDLDNNYAQLLPPSTVQNMRRTVTGRLPNDYAVGSALLWSPFFMAAHVAARLLGACGASVSLDGTSYLHQALTLIGSITYGFMGLGLILCSCRRLVGASSAALAVVMLVCLTNVIYYAVVEPSMSHMCSLFAVALFVELWLGARPSPRGWQWGLLGMAGGLIMLVRLPDATFLALPVLDEWLAGPRITWASALRRMLHLAVLVAAAAVTFAPQMIVWQVLNGSPVLSGYLVTDQATFFWLQPKIIEVLGSLEHGLYAWHPITLAATAGLIWLDKQDRRLAWLCALGFAMQVYVIGAWRDWSQGDAFGGRMFISSLPVLGLGLAALIRRLSSGRAAQAAWTGAGVLLIWNALFMVQYRLRYIPMSGPITLEQMTVGKFTMLADLAQRLAAWLGH